MKFTTYITTSLFSLFVLSGCSTWHHPYKTEAEFYADQNKCNAEAASVYPVNKSYYTVPGHSSPAITNCTNTGFGTINCVTTGGYQAPSRQISTGDTNAISRSVYASNCLKGLGYTNKAPSFGGDSSAKIPLSPVPQKPTETLDRTSWFNKHKGEAALDKARSSCMEKHSDYTSDADISAEAFRCVIGSYWRYAAQR